MLSRAGGWVRLGDGRGLVSRAAGAGGQASGVLKHEGERCICWSLANCEGGGTRTPMQGKVIKCGGLLPGVLKCLINLLPER